MRSYSPQSLIVFHNQLLVLLVYHALVQGRVFILSYGVPMMYILHIPLC
jgi:hypothetical protein